MASESVEDRPEQVTGAAVRPVRNQIVVVPYHQHERVTGAEKLFESPWGVEQVLAEAYGQMIAIGLLPYRVFQAGDDQWLFAEAGPNRERAERFAKHLDHQLQSMRLPLIAFAQTVAAPRETSAEELTLSEFPLK